MGTNLGRGLRKVASAFDKRVAQRYYGTRPTRQQAAAARSQDLNEQAAQRLDKYVRQYGYKTDGTHFQRDYDIVMRNPNLSQRVKQQWKDHFDAVGRFKNNTAALRGPVQRVTQAPAPKKVAVRTAAGTTILKTATAGSILNTRQTSKPALPRKSRAAKPADRRLADYASEERRAEAKDEANRKFWDEQRGVSQSSGAPAQNIHSKIASWLGM